MFVKREPSYHTPDSANQAYGFLLIPSTEQELPDGVRIRKPVKPPQPLAKTPLRSQLPHVAFYKSVHVKCATEMPDVTCYGYTAWDPVEKAVIISFLGTATGFQMTDEILSSGLLRQRYLFKYFHDAFFFLWNGGLEQQVRTLKYQYPDYKVYVTGHSLGASIASITAAYLVKWNMWTPEKRSFSHIWAATNRSHTRIVSFTTVTLYLIFRQGLGLTECSITDMKYNNNMAVGQPYTVCQEADGDYCSNTVISAETWEHMWYFDRNIGEWGQKGCPS
ncbi:triacylglycerol lipase [Cooperia oncophora]